MRGWSIVKDMIKVIIAGSRGFNDYKLLATTCDHMLQNHRDVEIVSGGAAGADKLGELYAEQYGYEIKQFIPDWSANGNAAGYMQSQVIVNYADALIVFWNGEDKETLYLIQIAKYAAIKAKICNY